MFCAIIDTHTHTATLKSTYVKWNEMRSTWAGRPIWKEIVIVWIQMAAIRLMLIKQCIGDPIGITVCMFVLKPLIHQSHRFLLRIKWIVSKCLLHIHSTCHTLQAHALIHFLTKISTISILILLCSVNLVLYRHQQNSSNFKHITTSNRSILIANWWTLPQT